MTKPLLCPIHNIKRTSVGIKKSFLKCKICAKEKLKSWREKNKEKVKSQSIRRRNDRQEWIKKDRKNNPKKWQEYSLKGYSLHKIRYVKASICRRFNLTLEQYENMFKYHNDKCAICNKPETRKPKNSKKVYNLCIDHCHKNESKGIMKIRGLLCHKCNHMIGHANDDINILRRAISYLESHNNV